MSHGPPSPSEGSEYAAGYVLNIKMYVLIINMSVLIIKWMLSTAKDRKMYPKNCIPVLQMQHLILQCLKPLKRNIGQGSADTAACLCPDVPLK